MDRDGTGYEFDPIAVFLALFFLFLYFSCQISHYVLYLSLPSLGSLAAAASGLISLASQCSVHLCSQ